MNLNFKADKDKQMLYGPFLIPNMLIYRKDDKIGEYNVRFSSEQIGKISSKFNSNDNNKNINFQHTDKMVEAFVDSNWLVGEGDESKTYGFDLPEGTWFGGVKITDSKFWEENVKSNIVNGFSVEISADLQLKLSETKNNNIQMENELELSSSVLDDGTSIYYTTDKIVVGAAIFTDEAMTSLISDGDYTLEDGTMITVLSGNVSAMTPPVTPPEPIDIVAPTETQLAVDPNAAPAPMAPATPAPVAETSAPLTASEVSSMIDARFSDLMEEISMMKELIGQSDSTMNDYKKQIEEKFSSTPAVESIKVKTDVAFNKDENRIKEFARIK